MKSDIDQYLKSGCNDHLGKPFTRPELFDLLSHYLPAVSDGPVNTVQQDIDEMNAFISEIALPDTHPDTAGNPHAGIDPHALQKYVDDPNSTRELIEAFLVSADECMWHIELSLDTECLKNIELYSHKLKGACLYVGAERLSQIAKRIEFDSKDGKLPSCLDLYKQLKCEHERVKEYFTVHK